MSNSHWKPVPLGLLLSRRREDVVIEDDCRYKRLTIRLEHKGVELRDEVDGAGIGTKRQFRVHEGQFILSKIDARNGAFGVVPANCDGGVITGNFWTFDPDNSLLNPHFFRHFSRTRDFNDFCIRASSGSTNRRYLQEDRFLAQELLLPPIEEQERIVDRIEYLAERTAQATTLHEQVLTEGDVLIRSLADQAYRSLAEQYGSMPLQSGCVSITDGDHLTPTFAASGVAFIFVGNVSSGHLHFDNCKYVDPAYFAALSPLRKPKPGDVLYSAVGATLGVPAIVDSDRQFCFQRHVAILRPDQSRLRSKFLWHMLRSSTVFKAAWSATTGTAQPTIPLRAIRALQIPYPPLEVQDSCVSRLERLNAMSLDGQHERKKMGAELKALLPSILDRAFRGEL